MEVYESCTSGEAIDMGQAHWQHRTSQHDISQFLTTAQVAAMTGEKLATIKKRCERGSLPALRWDGRYMIHIDDVTPQKGKETPKNGD